jgi:uncharacterized protein (TIGR03435 family)
MAGGIVGHRRLKSKNAGSTLITIPRFLAIALAAMLLTPAVAQVHFEVASIHPSGPGASPQTAHAAFSGDRFDAVAMTVGDILDMLNGWQLHRVLGGPAWMTTDRFDIHAKADAPIPAAAQKDAVMALLADRFKLTVHHETRDVPAMVLLLPKQTPGIKSSAPEERYSVPYFARDQLKFTAVPMSALTNYLSNVWHLPVVDQTGLEGTFDFTLNPSSEPGESWGDRMREALTTAGFKIEEKKVPTDVTVVDTCERPSDN